MYYDHTIDPLARGERERGREREGGRGGERDDDDDDASATRREIEATCRPVSLQENLNRADDPSYSRKVTQMRSDLQAHKKSRGSPGY